MSVVNPWTLCHANGSVADLTAGHPWPAAPSGTTKGKEATVLDKASARVASVHLPEVVICEHIDFGGANERTNLNYYFVGDWWNDKISSIIVVSGTWRFYEHWHYEGRHWDLGPGYYRWVEDAGIPNDLISSFQAIAY